MKQMLGKVEYGAVEHKREQNSDIYAICITNIRFKQSKCNSEFQFPKETQETGSTLNWYNIWRAYLQNVLSPSTIKIEIYTEMCSYLLQVFCGKLS